MEYEGRGIASFPIRSTPEKLKISVLARVFKRWRIIQWMMRSLLVAINPPLAVNLLTSSRLVKRYRSTCSSWYVLLRHSRNVFWLGSPICVYWNLKVGWLCLFSKGYHLADQDHNQPGEAPAVRLACRVARNRLNLLPVSNNVKAYQFRQNQSAKNSGHYSKMSV